MSSPEDLRATIIEYYEAIRGRIEYSFSGIFSLSNWEWIRLAGFVVAYIIVRPLLVKGGAWIGEKEWAHRERKENERKDKERRARKAEAKAKIGANALRTGKVPGEVESDEEEEVVEGVRVQESSVRRRKGAKKEEDKYKGLSAEKRKILEDMESDDDIEDLLA